MIYRKIKERGNDLGVPVALSGRLEKNGKKIKKSENLGEKKKGYKRKVKYRKRKKGKKDGGTVLYSMHTQDGWLT